MSKLRPDTRLDSAAQADGMTGKDIGYNKSSERILTDNGHRKPSRNTGELPGELWYEEDQRCRLCRRSQRLGFGFS